MRIGPDCKIYLNTPGSVTCMHVINSPDRKGIDCDFKEQGVLLPARNGGSLPSYPHYRIDEAWPCDSTIQLSIVELERQSNQFNVYYNSEWDQLILQSININIKKAIFGIYDLNGKVLHEYSLDSELKYQNYSCESLVSGLYIYIIHSEKGIHQTGKILISN